MSDASTDDQLVRLEHKDDVAVIQLDHPKMNVLSTAVLEELSRTLALLEADLPHAVVLWGGERVFSAGADVFELMDDQRAGLLLNVFRQAFDALASFPRATIAAIRGVALGGGCEIALACDFRVAADNARLGLPEVHLGIFPGAGATQRLPRLIGSGRAKQLMLTGRQVPAAEALQIGLVDQVLAPDDVLGSALELAATLGRGALRAHDFIKRAVDRGIDLPLSEGLDLERQLFEEVLRTRDAQVGMQTFAESGPGKATFTGT